MAEPVVYFARSVTWGFVQNSPAAPSGPQWEIHLVPKIELPVQFSKVVLGVTSRPSVADQVVLILWSYTTEGREPDLALAWRTLETQHPGAGVVFGRSEHRSRFARVELDAGDLPVSVAAAAAAAVSVVNGTLDDLEGAEVYTASANYHVGVSFKDDSWRAAVDVAAEQAHAPDGAARRR